MPLYELDGHKVATPPGGLYWVAPNAIVIGRVELAEDVSIWFGATIRGDNELIRIGARTNIQEGCVLHTDLGFPLTLGEDCTVGHMAMLHGCEIGKGALIGIGAIVLNGAKIGEGAVVGAGAIVPEGREIPAGMIALGTPAKVVREVTDADRQRIQEGVEFYRDNWRRYARGMKPQPTGSGS
jgi:carbonic anhydrase/acetyltransferase-like protein (isoleucine patch superfamily)